MVTQESDQPGPLTSSHSNSVTIICSMIQSISYIENSLVITGGQPASPPPQIEQDGEGWTLTLNCGRKASDYVAGNFNQQCQGAQHEYAPNGGGGAPSQLNFYFGVTITFWLNGGGQGSVDVYLAQGNYTTVNNWWIGGSSIISQGQPVLQVTNDHVIEQIFTLSGNTDSFLLNPT